MQPQTCQFVSAIQKHLKEKGSTDKILSLQNATSKLSVTLNIKLFKKLLRENTQIALPK